MKKRAEDLKDPVLVLFDEPTVSIKLIFPEVLRSDSLSGTITFYRPNAPEKDKIITLQLNDDGTQVIPVHTFDKGRWRLSVEWESDSLRYLEEKNILI